MTRPFRKLSSINRLKHYMSRHYMSRHYMLVFMLGVLMLAPACGRRGDLYLPPASETQTAPQLAAPAKPIKPRH